MPAGQFPLPGPALRPLSRTSSFTGYQPQGFQAADQERLASCVHVCHGRGLKFVLSNSATEEVSELYGRYTLQTVMAKRRVNCDAHKRGFLPEVIVTNAGIAPMEK